MQVLTIVRTWTIASAAMIATAASAQSIEPIFVAHHLSFEEVDAVTGEPVARPSGSIDPGQGARIRLTVSFVPDVGITWQSPTGFSRKVHAFGMTHFNLEGGVGTVGSWHSLEHAPGLGEPYQLGQPVAQGRVVHAIGVSQAFAGANQANPIEHVWQGVWVPAENHDRTVVFRTDPRGINPPYTSGLWMEGNTAVTCPTVTDSIELRVSSTSFCYPNCNNATVHPILSVDDFSCFINEFTQAMNLPHEQQVTHYANCDGSTVAPALTVNDFTCFINEFAQGCP